MELVVKKHVIKHVVTPFYDEKNMDKIYFYFFKWITMHYLLN
jgi:hypothetical protein